MLFIDPTGMDNIIYLIVLGNAGEKVDAQSLIDQTNSYLNDLGVDVRMQMFDHGTADDFDADNLDPTDAFAVLGENPNQVAEYIAEKNGFMGASLDAYVKNYPKKGRSTLEVNTGQAIALDEAQSPNAIAAYGGTPAEAAAYLTVHSYGHNIADLRHSPGEDRDVGFMSPGSEGAWKAGGINGLINSPDNHRPLGAMRAKQWSVANLSPS